MSVCGPTVTVSALGECVILSSVCISINALSFLLGVLRGYNT